MQRCRSVQTSTLGRAGLKIGVAEGVFPFAKIHSRGEWHTRSAVCTSLAPHSLRSCLGQGASLGEEAALADSGREGEITAGVGRVGSQNFLSILLKVSGRLGRRRGDDCQNTVTELPSVILSRSSWLSKKMMPRSVPVSYRRFTSVSKPVQLQNLTGPPAICPGVRSSEP